MNMKYVLKAPGRIALDLIFADLAKKHAEHPDVTALPCDEIVSKLRRARDALANAKKDMSLWVPPVDDTKV